MLPEAFVYSQTSLQDFTDCPALFDLRWRQRIKYPAAESEPLELVEAHMERGALFHQMIHQHLIGVPENVIAESIDDDELGAWWANYLASGLRGLPAARHPEITLSVPIAGRRMVAKLDVLAVDAGRESVIVDWKTSLHRPTRANLLARLQTVVYRYVLVEAGAYLNGGTPVDPAQVKMIYWFANFANQPEIFTYSADEHAAAGAMLTQMISDIERRGDGDFPLTDDVRRCVYCSYRGLHERGTKAGDFEAQEIGLTDELSDAFPDFTLDQIAEVAF